MRSVDDLCEEVMSDWKLPLSERLRICREIRRKAKRGDSINSILKALAGIYMGSRWAKSTGANGVIGGYVGYLLSKQL